jgi:signal transduction histidine kinase
MATFRKWWMPACALAVAGLGLVVVAGWTLRVETLPQIKSGYIPMAPSTAWCFVLLGGTVAAALAAPNRPAARRAAALAGALVAVASGLLLAQWALQWTTDMERLLLPQVAALGGIPIGRISPLTAGLFVPAGLAAMVSLFTGRRQWATVGCCLGCAVTVVGGVVLLAYAYGAPLLYGGTVIPPALPTAAAFVLLGLSLAGLAGDQAWPVRTLAGSSSRARLLRTFLPIIVLVVVVAEWVDAWDGLHGRMNPAIAAVMTAVVLSLLAAVGADGLSRRLGADLDAAADALRQAKEAAESANRTKDQFLAMLSHELRTPLTPVMLTLSMLEKDPALSPDLRDELAMTRQNVELEARLIDDLLDLSRITHGKLRLELRTVDAHALLEQVLGICRPAAEVGKITLTTQWAAANHHVWGDATRLQQVFWNVLQNAVKYTPEHGNILVRTRDGQRGQLEVEIRDNGSGIDTELLPRIFDAFKQGETAVGRRFGGLGLGLSITKAIVDLHRGSITAASAGRGHGSTFTLSLPAMPATPTQPRAPARPNPLKALNILLVEDEALSAAAIARALRDLGHQVRQVGNIHSALQAVAQEPFDLLLSDIGLPDGSGLDIMRHAATHYGLCGIALSGYGMESDVQDSLRAGFAAHLVKPIDVERLRAAITQVTQ